jgi:hypothetical protein
MLTLMVCIDSNNWFYEIIIIIYYFNSNFFFTDEDEIYDDKNFHSAEQDEFEIPDGKCIHITICALYICKKKYVYFI